MDAAVSAAPGSLIGGYRIGAPIGRGPLGRVYHAIHVASGRGCAIKLFSAHRVSADGVRGFGRAAEIAASTPGGGSSPLLEVSPTSDPPFAAMAIAPGEVLSAILARGALDWRSAGAVAAALSSHLAALHKAGVIHGNLKPANLVVERDAGTVRALHLLDVGSHALREPSEGDSTRAHDFYPVDYQAPEQLLGENVGPPTDLYAVGVLLFEMIVGDRPFTGSIAEIAYQHIRATPPALARPGLEIPFELGALVQRLLAKDPTARPAAVTVVGELQRLSAGTGAPMIDEEASTRLWSREDLPISTTPAEHTVVAPRLASPPSTPTPTHSETVMLPHPGAPPPGDNASITLIPSDIGAEFLPDSTSTTERRLRQDTSVGNNPSATVFVHPDHLAQATASGPAKKGPTRWWDRPGLAWAKRVVQGPWPLQKKLLVINITCMIIVLVGLVAIVSTR